MQYIYLIIGCVSLGLGSVGVVLPVLPTVPFFLLSAYCFAASSERLHKWFINTNMYKKNLESYVEGKGMTWKTKLHIVTVITAVMGLGFFMMSDVPVGRTILAIVWVCHAIYFVFGIRTIK